MTHTGRGYMRHASIVRRAARTDANHKAVVEALRKIPGVSVLSLAAVGNGVPDLLVGRRGANLLMEIKAGPNKKLTADQETFFGRWQGNAVVVRSVQEAVDHVLSSC